MMTVGTQVDEAAVRNALRHALDGLFMIDRERRVVMFSEGCERITGHNSASVVGAHCTCHETVHCQDDQGRSLAGELCPARQIFAGEIRDSKQRMSIGRPDGRRVWIETAYSPLMDAHGGVACVVGVMRDVTDQMTQSEAPVGEVTCCTSSGESLDTMLATLERREILAALRRADGQRTLAAKQLGISRSRLYRRMEALGIDPRNVPVQPD